MKSIRGLEIINSFTSKEIPIENDTISLLTDDVGDHLDLFYIPPDRRMHLQLSITNHAPRINYVDSGRKLRGIRDSPTIEGVELIPVSDLIRVGEHLQSAENDLVNRVRYQHETAYEITVLTFLYLSGLYSILYKTKMPIFNNGCTDTLNTNFNYVANLIAIHNWVNNCPRLDVGFSWRDPMHFSEKKRDMMVNQVYRRLLPLFEMFDEGDEHGWFLC